MPGWDCQHNPARERVANFRATVLSERVFDGKVMRRFPAQFAFLGVYRRLFFLSLFSFLPSGAVLGIDGEDVLRG